MKKSAIKVLMLVGLVSIQNAWANGHSSNASDDNLIAVAPASDDWRTSEPQHVAKPKVNPARANTAPKTPVEWCRAVVAQRGVGIWRSDVCKDLQPTEALCLGKLVLRNSGQDAARQACLGATSSRDNCIQKLNAWGLGVLAASEACIRVPESLHSCLIAKLNQLGSVPRAEMSCRTGR